MDREEAFALPLTELGGVKIRAAREDDLQDILHLRHEFDRQHRYPGLWRPVVRRENLARYRQMLHKRVGRLFVAEQFGRTVGFLTASIETRNCADGDFRRVGIIGDVYVEKTHRRRGIGSALTLAAAIFLSSRHIKHVALRNAIRNKLANRFWEGLTFKPVLYMRTTTVDGLTRALAKKARMRIPIARRKRTIRDCGGEKKRTKTRLRS
mgnify:CR=1 FL=1